MTIREVLNADWTVDRVDITVRDRETTKYIMRYCIGRDVMPGKYDKFVYEAEAGTVYSDCKKRILFINRIIQFRQLEEKPRGRESNVGVLEREVPAELLDLQIDHMFPYHCGWSDGMHGYCFTCYVKSWSGIKGENKQIELEEPE